MKRLLLRMIGHPLPRRIYPLLLFTLLLFTGCYTTFGPTAAQRDAQRDAQHDAKERDASSLQPDDPGYHDPQTATLLGVLVPGGGQLYAGETGKGIALLGVATAAPIIGTHLSTNAVIDDCLDPHSSVSDCTSQANLAPLYVGLGVSTAAWILGFASADEAAERANAAEGRVSLQPVALRELHGPVRRRGKDPVGSLLLGVQLSYHF